MIYIVTASSGDRFSYKVWNVKAFYDEDAAELYAWKAKEEADRLNEKYRNNFGSNILKEYRNEYDAQFRAEINYPTYYGVEELELL